jgi:YVTN family beta-propeller protein
VYVACRGSNHILLINSNTNFVDNIIPVGTAPNFLAFDAANKRLIVTNEGSASVSFLNENFSQPLSLQHSITTVPIGAAPVQAASLPDGSRVYVATQGNNVVVIDSSTLTVKTNIAVGGSGQQIGVSSDGIRVAVTTAAPDVLQVIDTSTDTVAASHTLVGPARALLIF